MRPSTLQIILLVLIIILLFGARRLPDLARSVGQSLKIFKGEVKDLTEDRPSSPPADRTTPPAADGTTPVDAPPATSTPVERTPRSDGTSGTGDGDTGTRA